MENNNINSTRTKLSDFSKKALMACYRLLRDYFDTEDALSEKDFTKMCHEIETYRIAIPVDIYNMFYDYVNKHIEPIIYDAQRTHEIAKHGLELFKGSENYSDEDIEFGSFLNTSCFIMKKNQIETELEEFAMENLYPLLIE